MITGRNFCIDESIVSQPPASSKHLGNIMNAEFYLFESADQNLLTCDQLPSKIICKFLIADTF